MFVSGQKITTKNAFGLHLIDYMADILKQKDSELTNFKVRELHHRRLLLLLDVSSGSVAAARQQSNGAALIVVFSL